MRGLDALFLYSMLTELEVKSRVEEWLSCYTCDADFFVERVEVRGDSVRVYIDRDEDVSLEECASVSRGLSEMLELAGADVSLEVSSPGLSEPIVHPRVFKKRLGTRVELQLKEHRKVRGILHSYDGQRLELAVSVKERVEGKKRPVQVERIEEYMLSEVQQVRVSFDK